MTLREKIEKFFLRDAAGRYDHFEDSRREHEERERKRYHEALARHKENLARYDEGERQRRERERKNPSGYRSMSPLRPKFHWTPMRFR